MKKVITYFNESFEELKLVTWPEWPDLNKSSVMVVIATLLSGALLFGIDKIIEGVMAQIY